MLDHARAAALRQLLRYHRGCPNRPRALPRQTARTRGNPQARAAASRVITTSDRGSGSDIRGRRLRRERGVCVGIVVLRRIYFVCLDARPLAKRARNERATRRSSVVARRYRLRAGLIVDVIAHHRADLAIDWVAERGFVPLVRLCPDVRRVVPFGVAALARARRSHRSTWREIGAFRRELHAHRYAAILDLQEQVKGAIVRAMARGRRHGFDRASMREPLATLAHDVHHRVTRDLHFVVALPPARRRGARLRGRRPAALESRAAPTRLRSCRIALRASCCTRPAAPEKLWPEDRWRALIAHFSRAGLRTVLPWGSADEQARSRRLAEGLDGAVVPPWLSLPEAATILARADVAVGVDTGFTHLAAALGTPTVARVLGDRSAPARRRDLRAPCAGCGRQRARPVAGRGRGGRRRGDARIAVMLMRPLYTLLWWLALPVACHCGCGGAGAGSRAIAAHRRAFRMVCRRRAARVGPIALDPRGVAGRNARRGAARRAPAARAAGRNGFADPHDGDRPGSRTCAVRRSRDPGRGCPTTCRSPCAGSSDASAPAPAC